MFLAYAFFLFLVFRVASPGYTTLKGGGIEFAELEVGLRLSATEELVGEKNGTVDLWGGPRRSLPTTFWYTSSHLASGHGLLSGNLMAVLHELPSSYVISFEIFPRSNGAYAAGTWYNILDLHPQLDLSAHSPSLFFCNSHACDPYKLVLQFGSTTFLDGKRVLELDRWQTVFISVESSSVSLSVTSENGTMWSVSQQLPIDHSNDAGAGFVASWKRDVLVFASSPHHAAAAANLRNWKIDLTPGQEYPGLFIDAYQWFPDAVVTNGSDAELPDRDADKYSPCDGSSVWRSAANIEHVWRRGTAVAGCSNEFVLLRFRGHIAWPASQEVLFQAEADDGFHLSIGGRTVLGDGGDWAVKTSSTVGTGRHRFIEGVSEALEAWFFQVRGDAAVSLLHSLDGGRSWAPVPASCYRLYAAPVMTLPWLSPHDESRGELNDRSTGSTGAKNSSRLGPSLSPLAPQEPWLLNRLDPQSTSQHNSSISSLSLPPVRTQTPTTQPQTQSVLASARERQPTPSNSEDVAPPRGSAPSISLVQFRDAAQGQDVKDTNTSPVAAPSPAKPQLRTDPMPPYPAYSGS